MAKCSSYKFRVVERFKDAITGEYHEQGSVFVTDSVERAKVIEQNRYGVLISAYKNWKEKPMQMVVYSARVFAYGGIETALLNIAKHFKERVSFVFTYCDLGMLDAIGEYSPVKIEDDLPIKCNVLLVMGYDGLKLMRKSIDAKKIYHQIHADWASLREIAQYREHKLDTNGIDRFLAVSPTVQSGLQKAYGLDSVLVPNILVPEKLPDFRLLVALTRLEREKGGDILVELLKRFQNASKRFVCIVCGAGSEQSVIWQAANLMPNVMLLPADRANVGLLRKADYLVQTSRTEAYGYAMHEALANGVPVLATRLPETERLIQNGKNGYIFNADFSDLDIDAIFDKVPKFEAKQEKVEPVWEKVFKGEL